jgi:superfamily II DNA or RNA helicase
MRDVLDYREFLARKSQVGSNAGFEPKWLPDWLFQFQRALVEWAVRKGRAALLCDCGLGKTPMQLVWAENVVRHTGRPVLILTPLAVTQQTKREAEKFSIECALSRDGKAGPRITVTNYEKLHHFSPEDFSGVVCDESSILKSFTGATRKRITRFINKLPFRLLCAATAAPNDYVELGTSSEALGELSHSDMLKRFFWQLDDKGQKRESRLQAEAEAVIEADPNYFKKLAYRVAQTIGQWRLKHHAVVPFWRWVASWARACRKPSDLGFADDGFILPELRERAHVITPKSPPPGFLFNLPAVGMAEERAERRRTLAERSRFAAALVAHQEPAVVWCHMNEEADRLVKEIPGAEQIAGRTPDDRKVELYEAFSAGRLRVLVIKPKIGAWGLNWQHCNHVVTYPSHSYEQFYQSVRRCWRFGQKRPVTVDVVATEGEIRVMGNMQKKAEKADRMFEALVREMTAAERVNRVDEYTNKTEVPAWLRPNN